jgi:hypothetical protein
MQIKCHYCGASVDAAKQSACPNCGASLSDNEQYQEYHAEKQKFYNDYKQLLLKDKEARIKKQQLENEKAKTAPKTVVRNHYYETNASFAKKKAKIGCLVPIITFATLFVIGIIGSVFSEDHAIYDPVETVDTYVEPHHNAVAGEIIQTRDYQVVLDKWGYYTPEHYAINDGEKYIKFHFTYTNTSKQQIFDDEQIFCYDSNGRQCDSQYGISDEDKTAKMSSQWIYPGKSYSGWVYFCLPESETRVTLTYGDNIEISIVLNEEEDLFDKETATVYYKGNFNEIITTKKLDIIIDDWGYYTPEMILCSGKKFIKLHVTYTNISTKNFEIDGNAYCYDANGAEYGSTSMFLLDEDKAQMIKNQDIETNKSYSGWYYFEIPESINELTVKLFKNVEVHVNLAEVDE